MLQRQVLLDVSIVLLFVLVLIGTPCFIERAPRMLDAYSHISQAFVVQSTGAFNSPLVTENFWNIRYLVNYPGSFVFISTFLSVTGLPWDFLLKFFPVFLMMFLSTFIYLIAKKLLGLFCILPPILFLSFAWFEEFHFSPQSFSLMLYLTLWLFLIYHFYAKKTPNSLTIISIVLVGVSIVISHQATPVFVLFNLISLVLLGLLVRRFLPKQALFLLLLLISLFIIWFMFTASDPFVATIDSIWNILNSDSSSSISARVVSSNYYLVKILRTAIVAITNIIGVLLGIYLLRRKKIEIRF